MNIIQTIAEKFKEWALPEDEPQTSRRRKGYIHLTTSDGVEVNAPLDSSVDFVRILRLLDNETDFKFPKEKDDEYDGF